MVGSVNKMTNNNSVIVPVADQVAIPIADRGDVYVVADEVDVETQTENRDELLRRVNKEHLCCNACDDDLFRYLITGMVVFLTAILLFLMVAEKKN